MGLGPAARELYTLLDIKPPLSVCDLGSQEMSFVEDGQQIHRESARAWMERQGFKYACIDMDGKHGALRLDLNTITYNDVTIAYRGATYYRPPSVVFDIVANHGTSEHVFDQANVFRLMHDLTTCGGLMIHAVPTPQFGAGHGFYFYDETIFNDLAHANRYEIVHMFRRREPYEIILVALRKVHDAPFAMPIQGIYRQS